MKLTELYYKDETKVWDKAANASDYLGKEDEEPKKVKDSYKDKNGNYIGPYSDFKSINFLNENDLNTLITVLTDLHKSKNQNKLLIKFLEDADKKFGFVSLFDSTDINLLNFLINQNIIDEEDLNDKSSRSNPLHKSIFFNSNKTIEERTFIVQTWLWFKIHGKENQDLGDYIKNLDLLKKLNPDLGDKIVKAKGETEKINNIFRTKWDELTNQLLYKNNTLQDVDIIKNILNQFKDDTEDDTETKNQTSNGNRLPKKKMLNNLLTYKFTEDDLKLLKDIIRIKSRELKK